MSTDPRVDAYIAKSAPFARPLLAHLRALVHRGCPEVEETIKWGMPSFVYGGKILCGMAAFKGHCTFGFWHAGMKDVLGKDVAPREKAMGSFGRLTSPEDLPADRKIIAWVKAAAKLNESGEPARPRAKARRSEAAVPDDLAAALKKNRAAAATWAGFPPSCRREYVEWITEARREETRARRVAQTIAWLAEGKRRSWKYEGC